MFRYALTISVVIGVLVGFLVPMDTDNGFARAQTLSPACTSLVGQLNAAISDLHPKKGDVKTYRGAGYVKIVADYYAEKDHPIPKKAQDTDVVIMIHTPRGNAIFLAKGDCVGGVSQPDDDVFTDVQLLLERSHA